MFLMQQRTLMLRVAALAVAAVLVASVPAFSTKPAAAQGRAELLCASDGGLITWSGGATDVDSYWIYRSTNGGETYQWLGRAAGDVATIADPAPRIGARYQVHHAGVPRRTCSTTNEPPPPNCSASGVLEAEDALLAGRFEVGAGSSASAGAYAHVPRGTGGEWNGARGNFVEFCATVEEAGPFRIDATVLAPSYLKRSFYVSVDGGNVVEFVAPATAHPRYQTVSVNDAGVRDPLNGTRSDTAVDTVTWDLAAGEHFIRFHLRRDGTRLDKIALVPAAVEPVLSVAEIEANAIRAIYLANGVAPPEFDSACDVASSGLSIATAVRCDAAGHVNFLGLGARNREQIFVIPPEIGELTNLTRLNLGEVRLAELPPEIGELTKLTQLSMSGNKLTKLPPAIGKLTDLTRLIVSGNHLSGLPAEIGQLTKLQQIVLLRNWITELPPEIGHLESLTSLDLRENAIAELPPSIGDLAAVTHISLEDNKLTSLPSEIGHLDNLRLLNVVRNRLRGDITAIEPLLDTGAVTLADGEGGNDCLTTTSESLAAVLNALTADWSRCDNP